MSFSCTRRIQFCSGHRVMNHESKCANMHGHNYVAYFEATTNNLDELGRVIDFSVLKEKIGSWIDANWDHAFIYYKDDSVVHDVLMQVQSCLGAHKDYELPLNPTAENLAMYLYHEICPMLLEGTGVRIKKVTLEETENCSASYGDENVPAHYLHKGF